MHNYYLHLKQIHNIVDVDFSVNKNQLREQIEEMNKSDFAVITNTIKEDMIKGEFIVSGDYKVSDKSVSVDPFNLNLPFEIVIDEKYDTRKATLDIDDFYYEIVNDNVLRIAIDVLIDNLEEKGDLNKIHDYIDQIFDEMAGTNKNDYDLRLYIKFKYALETAVSLDENSTKEEIDKAYDELKEAYENMTRKESE